MTRYICESIGLAALIASVVVIVWFVGIVLGVAP